MFGINVGKNGVEESYVIRKKNRSQIVIALAILFAIAAAGSILVGVKAYLGLTTVVVTAVDMPEFHIIDVGDLTTKEIPTRFATDMFTNPRDLIGQVSRTYIPKGSTIKLEQLSLNVRGSILSARVTEQNDRDVRGFSIPLEALSAAGGDIAEGDIIDIYGVITLPQVEKDGKTSSNSNDKTENVVAKILATQVKIIKVIRGEDSSRMSGIEVALTPQEIQDVNFAMLTGKLSIAVNPYDTNVLSSLTYPTTAETFYEQYITEIPPRLKKLLREKGMTEEEIAIVEAEYREMLKEKLGLEDPEIEYFDKDGNRIDKDGNLLPPEIDYFDKEGKRINKDGQLIDEDGKLINEDGNLIDENGEVILNEDGTPIAGSKIRTIPTPAGANTTPPTGTEQTPDDGMIRLD